MAPALKQTIPLERLSQFPLMRDRAANCGVLFEKLKQARAWVPDLTLSARIQLRSIGFARAITSGLFLLASVVTLCPDAQAVSSFSRQTGLACRVCHSNPPELTAFGRKFKLDGYTLTDKNPETTIDDKDMKLTRYFPIGGIFLLARPARTHPSPAHKIGPPTRISACMWQVKLRHILGGWSKLVITSQSGTFALNNADVRYANHTTLGSTDLLYGLMINNDPTVGDVWNSTPAWGYPWFSSDSAPSPTAGPLIEGALSEDVLGLGVYAMWDNHLYVGFSVYRSLHVGCRTSDWYHLSNQHSGSCPLLAGSMAAILGTELFGGWNLWHLCELDSEWSYGLT